MKGKLALALAAGAALSLAALLREVQIYQQHQWIRCFSFGAGVIYPVRVAAIQFTGYQNGMRVVFDLQGKFHYVHSSEEAKLDRLTRVHGGWPEHESTTA